MDSAESQGWPAIIILWKWDNKIQKYKIEIKETLSRIVTVEAESGCDACGIVETRYYTDCDIVLDASDFQDVEFEIVWNA